MRENLSRDELDEATRARLTRLAGMPVDVSNVQKRLRATMAGQATEPGRWKLPRMWRPLAAVAALVLIAVMVGLVVMSMQSRPAQAAPMDMARLFEESMKSGAMATKVTTIEEANKVLAGQWPNLPQMPTPQPGQIHACCIHDFMDAKVACLMLRDGETSLTLVIGHAKQFRPAEGRVVERGGRKFTVHEVNGLRMAMTSQGEQFICLMGEVPEERLLEIAGSLKF